MTEIYQLPQGRITISFCDKNLSIGLLDLDPNQALSKHNRPVDEELVQIYGASTIKLFDEDKLIKEVVLNEGEKLLVPANQFHIHANATNERSVTLWKFKDDIVEVIENIRGKFKKVL
jgi:quercetin dioxygenase-like cupin family protein